VVIIESELSNDDLLMEIEELEEFYGRERSNTGYLSREMDIDVLYIGDEIIDTEKLKVPHPKMHERKFVLVPLAELAPQFVHPGLKKNSEELMSICADLSVVKKC
jgi:2-amino-4-hydroxy-6-hydroxymethyldihydropteridine diphosphokinase